MIAPQTLILRPGPDVPNSRLPVLIFRGAIPRGEDGVAAGFEKLFEANGWGGTWRDGVYDYHHFHSNAHEVLGIEEGRAQLQLGGETGEAVDVEAGDVVLLPAGTGHCRKSKSTKFMVVGAYPPGQHSPDICRDRSPEVELRIGKTAIPETDPVAGKFGGLVELWR
jgi:uncharacterized protein YjlB